MRFMRAFNIIVVATVLGGAAGVAVADGNNIDLSTIPGRDSVQLTIYNSEDLTLVRETRHVTFRTGINPLQFSWANTLIDASSVDLRFVTRAADLDVVDTTFPHDKPQMLYWNVASRFDGDAVVEITYFTSGVTWAADYVCIADPGETEMSFEGFVRITNDSGEDYEDAQMRLVVGEINLVEEIADLARRGLISQDQRRERAAGRLGIRDMPEAPQAALKDAIARRIPPGGSAPKEIIKEGLSEYFIFTVEGTETVRTTWSKRMRLFQGLRVPFDVRYRFRPREYGEQLVRLFILRNDEKSRLGSTPLPDGVVRLFRDNGRDGLSFLTAYTTKYVPIGQEIELNLGVDPNVVHERVLLRSWRDEFWFRDVRGTKYFSPTQGRQVRNDYPVAGWNDHERWVERIRNYRAKPVDVEFRRSFGGDVRFACDRDVSLHDYQTPQYGAVIPAAAAEDLLYEVTTRQGYNSKQQRVEIAK